MHHIEVVRAGEERHIVLEDIRFATGDKAVVVVEDTVLAILGAARHIVVVGEDIVGIVVAAGGMEVVEEGHHMVGFEDMGFGKEDIADMAEESLFGSQFNLKQIALYLFTYDGVVFVVDIRSAGKLLFC